MISGHITNHFRHEYKYIISDTQIIYLQQRLDRLMQLDPNVGKDGYYSISSLYFDDYNNRCLYENICGADPREKYRIRMYNGNTGFLCLECKRKERGMTTKSSCQLTNEMYEMLINRSIPIEMKNQSEVFQRLAGEILVREMKPVIIVNYDRIPYIYNMGNVRITIDKNLTSSTNISNFQTGRYPRRPVMPLGVSLLEVKWDHFIPDEIYHMVQMDELQLTAYSKYTLCRKYSL